MDKPSSFEERMQELEKIVLKFKQGAASLEASLQDYQRGIELVKACRQDLGSFESRLEKLNLEISQVEDLDDQDFDDGEEELVLPKEGE